jgi:hypothetical protein
VEVVQL